jgi:ABC-2 type transport system ATP-binding protein
MFIQLDTGGADAAPVLERVPGVTRVAVSDRRDVITSYEVESVQGQDVRRELARAVVMNNWGLLELRPMRMSLEEIFLSLTTEETPEATTSTETVNA